MKERKPEQKQIMDGDLGCAASGTYLGAVHSKAYRSATSVA